MDWSSQPYFDTLQKLRTLWLFPYASLVSAWRSQQSDRARDGVSLTFMR
jgi:hypothetical protein